MTLPAYSVRVAKLEGSPYSTTTIKVAGIVIRSQLGTLTDAQVQGYVRDYLAPPPTSRLDDIATWFASDKKAAARSARGGKKKASVTATGFLWKADDE